MSLTRGLESREVAAVRYASRLPRGEQFVAREAVVDDRGKYLDTPWQADFISDEMRAEWGMKYVGVSLDKPDAVARVNRALAIVELVKDKLALRSING